MGDDLQIQARALGDPTRHRIFRVIVEATEPPSVAELTAAFGLNHNAIRQHLAKLEDAGLVVGTVEAVAVGGGRGRPSRRYSVCPGADSRWGVAGPYERLASWLAEVVCTGDTPFDVGRRVGAVEGAARRAAADDDPVAAVVELMERGGFDPVRRDRGSSVEVVLQTCPFVTTARADPDVVCELHHGIAAGVAEAVGGVVVDELVRADPVRAGCRLRCHAEPRATNAPLPPEELGGETACWAHLVDELDGTEAW